MCRTEARHDAKEETSNVPVEQQTADSGLPSYECYGPPMPPICQNDAKGMRTRKVPASQLLLTLQIQSLLYPSIIFTYARSYRFKKGKLFTTPKRTGSFVGL